MAEKKCIFYTTGKGEFVYGLRFTSLLDLIDRITEKKATVLEEPIEEYPSCSHYQNVSEMTTPFCPQCGTKNTIKRKGGRKEFASYHFLDFVEPVNGFPKIGEKRFTETRGRCVSAAEKNLYSVREQVKQKILENKGYIFLAGHRYRIVSNFPKGDFDFWFLNEGDKKCEDENTGTRDDTLRLAVEFSTNMSRSLLKYLIKKDDAFLMQEGFDDVLAAKNLQQLFGTEVDILGTCSYEDRDVY